MGQVLADDSPPGLRVDVKGEEVRLVAARPRPQREVADACELAGILDHPQPPEGKQAPPVLPHLVDVVDLEGLVPTALVRSSPPRGCATIVAGTVLLRQRVVVVWAAIAISMAARLPECCR